MITVNPAGMSKSSLYYQMQHLKEKIGSVVIKGLPTVNRAVIHMDDSEGAGSKSRHSPLSRFANNFCPFNSGILKKMVDP